MVDYKSRRAWDETHPQDQPSSGPSPRDEKRRGTFELGDITVPELVRQASTRQASLWPWMLTAVTMLGVLVAVVRVHLPMRETLHSVEQERDRARSDNAVLTNQVIVLEKVRHDLERSRTELSAAIQKKDTALAELNHAQEELAQKLEAEIQQERSGAKIVPSKSCSCQRPVRSGK